MKGQIEQSIQKEMSLLYTFALIAHGSMFVFFLSFGFYIMAIFNIFSVLLYLVLVMNKKKLNKNSFFFLTIVGSSIEVLLHQVLAIVCFGTEAGFQYFLIMLCILVILQPKPIITRRLKYVFCFLITFLFVSLELYAHHHSPIYEPPENVAQILMVIVSIVACFGIISFSFNQWNLSEHYRETTEDLLSESNTKIFQMQEKIIRNFADIIERRDGGTGEHIKRTSAYVEAIIDSLVESGKYTDILTPDYAKMVISAAPLHDIGKISISDIILCKKGKLTPEEYEIMKTHSGIGENMLKELLGDLESEEYVRIAMNISKYHHERFNGTGYPEGKKGTDIPLSARIMAVADVFDALTSVRVYKEKFSLDEAYRIMESEAGEQFDPVIITEFIRIRPRISDIYHRLS